MKLYLKQAGGSLVIKEIEYPYKIENENYYVEIKNQDNPLPEILEACTRLGIQSILVEGGADTLQRFIDAGLYDEIRVVTNTEMKIGDGLPAPELPEGLKLIEETNILTDNIKIYTK